VLEGAVLFCEGSPEAIAEALDHVARDVGYTRATGSADLELDAMAGERALAFSGALPKTFALALARRLAQRLRSPVRVLTARLIEAKPGRDVIDCDVDDLKVMPDGTSKPGRWAEDAIASYGTDWGQLCDGKAYFAVSSLLEDARETVLPQGEARPAIRFAAPASLGSTRLDEIARQVRLADRATLSEVGGRVCLRVTTGGTTVTSFLAPPEVATLRNAIGALLT
jgi:hypothetical protein